jgi:hypothetical protein
VATVADLPILVPSLVRLWWGEDLGAAGSTVASWTDRVAGEDVTQGTAASRPTVTVVGGMKYAAFDGVDDDLSGASPETITGDQDRTVITVAASDSADPYIPVAYGGYDAHERQAIITWTDPKVTDGLSGANMAWDTEDGEPGHALAVVMTRRTGPDNSDADARRNGHALTVESSHDPNDPLDTGSTDLRMGRNYNDSPHFEGRNAFIAIADTVLTDHEAQIVEGVLAHTYDLAGFLPADHPYKTTYVYTRGTPRSPLAGIALLLAGGGRLLLETGDALRLEG